MAERARTTISPFCARIRSKKYYFLEAPPAEESDILDGSGHCWCQHTMDSIGPDGNPVDPRDCQRERRCFESIGPSA